MTTTIPSQCLACQHLDRSETSPYSDLPVVMRCAAFPAGIPDDILLGGDHREPVGGETDGLTFQQEPGEEEAFARWSRVFGGGIDVASGGEPWS